MVLESYEQLPPSIKKKINSLYHSSLSGYAESINSNSLIYRLMLYSDYMPRLKKYFTTPSEALDAVKAHVQEHFPVLNYKAKFGEPKLLEHLEDCYDLIRIDTLRLPNYRELLPEGTSREGLGQTLLNLEKWMKAE